MLGGVRRRRPYLSNLAGEAVLEINDEALEAAPEPAEPVRLSWRSAGCCNCSASLSVSAGGGVGLALFTVTNLTAAWGS